MELKSSPPVPRLKDSNENVENVVNPPQNPTIKSAFNFGGTIPDLFRNPNNNPNNRHPAIFIMNVARGNGAL